MTASGKPHLITLVLLASISVLALNMFLPSLTHIAAEFHADYALVSLSVGGFLMVSAALQLIIGPLSDIYGRRPMILGSLALFLVASIGCLLAPNVWVFLGFRMLQASVTGVMTLSRAVVRDVSHKDEATRLFGCHRHSHGAGAPVGAVSGWCLARNLWLAI